MAHWRLESLLAKWRSGRQHGLVRCAFPVAFAGVTMLATGCTSTSIARNDTRRFEITQVAMQRRPSLFGTMSNYGFSQVGPVIAPNTTPRRASLFGSTAFGSSASKASSHGSGAFGSESYGAGNQDFQIQKGPALFEVQEHPFGDPATRAAKAQAASNLSTERLTAVAKLFEAQGRTDQALKVYQQIEQQANARGETSEMQITAAPALTAADPKLPQSVQHSEPAVLAQSNEPAKPIEESTTASSVPSQGLMSPPSHTETHVESVPELAAQTPNTEVAANSAGWRVSSQALAKSEQGENVTVSSAVAAAASSALPATVSSWESSKENTQSVSATSDQNSDSQEAMFELPANMPRPSRWEKSVDILPGKFLKPTVREATPAPVAKPALQAARPAPVDTPEKLPKSEAEVKATAKPAAAAEESVEEPDSDSSGMLIIPNGSKLKSRIPAARPAKAAAFSAKITEQTEANTEINEKPEPPLALLSGSLREIHSPTVLALATQLSASDPKTRSESASQLGQVGAEARTILPVLRQVLKSEKDKVARLRLAEAMVKIAPEDADAINLLIESLQDPSDWRYRQFAASALAATAAGADLRAVPKLSEALTDSHPRVRSMVALSLAAFGERAKEAVPRLEFAKANDIPRVKESATAALTRIKSSKTESGEAVAAPAPVPEEPLTLLPPRELENEEEATFIGGDGEDADANTVDSAKGEESPAELPSITE